MGGGSNLTGLGLGCGDSTRVSGSAGETDKKDSPVYYNKVALYSCLILLSMCGLPTRNLMRIRLDVWDFIRCLINWCPRINVLE